MTNLDKYSIRYLPHGETTIYAEQEGETFHCGLGPAAESKLLYVDQLQLESQWSQSTQSKPHVVWDVGLGAAANSTAVLTSWKSAPFGHLHLVSFDRTLTPLKCALDEHRKKPSHFSYLEGWDWNLLINKHSLSEGNPEKSITWEWILGDFVEGLKEATEGKKNWPVPHSILYDSYSPQKNWEMWRLDHWRRLRKYCGDKASTAVSYSRATGARVTFLLAGFYVGRGYATGLKPETTIVSTRRECLRELLDRRWFERVQRSHTSHPFISEKFEDQPISNEWLTQLSLHPQFAGIANS